MIRRSSVISLPNVRLNFAKKIFREEFLLVAGGRAPSSSWLRSAASGRTLFCIDRGADACREARLLPSLHIGDDDSASPDTLEWIKNSKIESRRFPTDKDKTDTQLALNLLAEKQDAFVLLSGSFGGRFDHAFSLVCAFAGTNLYGCLADNREFLLFLRDGDDVSLQISSVPKIVSLLPLSPICEGVSIDGVHWPLSGATLRQDDPYAVSNRLSSSDQSISVRNGKGILAVYLYWDESTL